MKLVESISENTYKGTVSVIPFFPFSMENRQESFEFLKGFFNTFAPTAIGLVYPGRRTLGPWHDGNAWGKGHEWDLFQYIYALKHQTGAPIVLAINYQDIIDFGIFPYAQEGHKIGLDTVLVSAPVVDELEYFTAEMTNGGVGTAFIIDGFKDEDLKRLIEFSTSFVYSSNPVPVDSAIRSDVRRRYFYRASSEAPVADYRQDDFTGWILEDAIGYANWNPDWSEIDSAKIWSEIQRWMNRS